MWKGATPRSILPLQYMHSILLNPQAKIVRPFVLVRQICRDNCKILVFWGTNNMNRAVRVVGTKYKAAMAALIFRIVLDDLTAKDHAPYIPGGDHSLGSCHLANCVRQKQDTFVCSLAD